MVRQGWGYITARQALMPTSLPTHLGNVRTVVVDAGGTAVSITNKTNYYPFGMAMPGRHVDGGYRYAYQGQEKDGETGMEAFQLRLWDARIGRWLTVDPYGEFYSPYLGMGNNPIRTIDPDGGCTDCPDPPVVNGGELAPVYLTGSNGGNSGVGINFGALFDTMQTAGNIYLLGLVQP